MIEAVMNAYRPDVLAEGPSVLVVDDEPSVRHLLGVLLQSYGYRAIIAADGVEARAAVAMEHIALILCDVHLQGESGRALVRDLLQVAPRTGALMMSGSDGPEAPDGTGEDLACGHIAKPFDVKDVLNRIAQVLCGWRQAQTGCGGRRGRGHKRLAKKRRRWSWGYDKYLIAIDWQNREARRSMTAGPPRRRSASEYRSPGESKH